MQLLLCPLIFELLAVIGKIIAPIRYLESLRIFFNVQLSASNARLCAIVRSSQMMIFDVDKTLAVAEFFAILRFASSII